jgi:hypothetical protein
MRMLILPTGQVLFNDSSALLWVYTPDGAAAPQYRPVVNSVVFGVAAGATPPPIFGGIFTLTGKQLNGASAGSAYGDDVESDQNYPIVRLTSTATGNVFYARTTNWSTTGVGTGSAPETVNFTLPSGFAPGNYSLVVSGAGISSFPFFINIPASEVPPAVSGVPAASSLSAPLGGSSLPGAATPGSAAFTPALGGTLSVAPAGLRRSTDQTGPGATTSSLTQSGAKTDDASASGAVVDTPAHLRHTSSTDALDSIFVSDVLDEGALFGNS